MSTRNRRKFTPEFKAEAVEMVKAADGNIALTPLTGTPQSRSPKFLTEPPGG